MTTDARILAVLRQASGGAVPAADLAARLGLSRATLEAHLRDLRRLGYEIEAHPLGGCRLRSSPDALHADDLLARLGATKVIGRDVRVFHSTTSTNDVVEKLARDGVAEGVVVIAEHQSRGRGRLGRAWISPSGKGLWFSVLLRPPLRPVEATRITIMAAAALARTLRDGCRLPVGIKWPNDLLLNGRKIGGSLLELSAETDRLRHVTLGIGLDVNLTASDYPPALRAVATSLRLEAGRSFDRSELAAEILRALDQGYARICAGEFPEIADEWESLCSTLGRDVAICVGPRAFRGRAEAIDDDGALLLRTEHGTLERIIGGDVSMNP